MTSPQPKEETPEEFDAEMAKKVKDFKCEAPFKVYGIAVINERFHCVSASVDTKGKTIGWKTHFHPEADIEFAQDTLKKVLAYAGVRY